MKKTFKFFMCAAIVASGFTACSDEVVPGSGPKTDPTEGEEGYASLTIRDASPITYGATAEETADGSESIQSANVATKVKKYIYKAQNGAFEPTADIEFDGSNPYTSKPFELMSGHKFIYVVAEQIPDPQPTTVIAAPNKGDFETQIIPANFKNHASETSTYSTEKRVIGIPEKIATKDQFFIATLWGKPQEVLAGGTEDNPVEIKNLTIGRLASKVLLNEVRHDPATSALKGKFDKDNVDYRLCSVPDALYLIGQWSDNDNSGNVPGTIITDPDKESGQSVFSLYHYEPWGTYTNNDPTKPVQNKKFKNYVWDKANKVKTPYYTVENTTARDAQKNQYYGNTTYIQMKIKYTPDVTELYNADGTKATSGMTGDGTFYTAVVNGKVLMFKGQPLSSIQGIDANSVKKYDKGFMYYSFPIKDSKEKSIELKNAVIRNHSYLVNVTSIDNLGETDGGEVKPDIPIEQETWITLEVTVLPWSQITQNVPL